MNRTLNLLFIALILSVLAGCKTTSATDPFELLSEIDLLSSDNILTVKEQEAGWQILFDGESFEGWHGYNMDSIPACWVIEDHAFTMTTLGGGESQDIITNQEYENFALSIEFRLTEAANSGIIFQVAEDTMYTFPYETGPEFQVIDHANWPDPLEDWQICGANYAMYPPLTRPYKQIGEWNHAFLVVNDNHVTQILNGEKVVEYTKYSGEWTELRNSGKWADYPDYGKYDKGYISLQNHGTRVWYRNIKIKVL